VPIEEDKEEEEEKEEEKEKEEEDEEHLYYLPWKFCEFLLDFER
jgi:hypothetical protein